MIPYGQSEMTILKSLAGYIKWDRIDDPVDEYTVNALFHSGLRETYDPAELKKYQIMPEIGEDIDDTKFTRFIIIKDGNQPANQEFRTELFAVVGIQRGMNFGRMNIRRAFLLSLNDFKPRPIWLTHTTVQADKWGLRKVNQTGTSSFWTL